MSHEYIARCRCCGSTELELVLNLGSQPLANSYTKEPVALPEYPLELVVCRSCFHNQLSVVVEPDLMFRHYLYVSGTSRTLRAHFDGLVEDALNWIAPRPSRILDVACNDGTLLAAFQRARCTVQGVDPARNLVRLASEKGLEVHEGYWPQVRPEVHGKFDLVTATNVLAHVANPRGFLAAAFDCLTDQGAVIVEFPYCRDMILQCEWDTIYHEHLSYFLVSPLLGMLDQLGAAVTHVRQVPIHGGSLRLALQRGRRSHCPDVRALVERESHDGLHALPTYCRFAQQAEGNCLDLCDLVGDLVASDHRVIGYGASAKGNTLLNRCPLPLAYIVDDNPLKHGYFTPGQGIPIKGPDAVRDEHAELWVLLLAWNFAKEIFHNLRTWRPGRADRAIHYVPRVMCHAIDQESVSEFANAS